MKAKTLPFHFALLIGFLLLGCSNDDANSGSNSASVGPKAPLGKKTQILSQGSTVSDIIVQGQNIRWYQLSYSLAETPFTVGDDVSISSEFSEGRILLSPQTILRDKNIYFATQTVNNIESKEYLQVSVKLLGVFN